MKKKKLLTFLLAAALMLENILPAYATGTDRIEKKEMTEVSESVHELPAESETREEIIEKKVKIPKLTKMKPVELDAEDIYAGMDLGAFEEFESRYDSRDLNIVTNVKDQTPWGTCWSFSTMALMETSLIMQGLEEKDSIDLSEMHLAYFTGNTGYDALGNANEDTICHPNEDYYLNSGGNIVNAAMRLINWQGAAAEADYPYSTDMPEDIPREKAQDIVATADEIYFIPTLGKSVEEEEIAIKNALKTYGAVWWSYYHDEEGRFYNSDTAAYNCNENIGVNHAITIVGWDDEYSKENFLDYCRPQNDGAWIVRNSWSENFGEEGYFYISYEDLSLGEGNDAGVLIADKMGKYDNNYFYSNGLCYSLWTETWEMAQVFEAKADREILKAVSFLLGSDKETYEVQVYKNPETVDGVVTDPTTGTPMYDTPVTGETGYAGLYTVDIPDVYLKKGDLFSVVVTFTDEDGATVYVDSTDLESAKIYETVETVNVTQAGQSFRHPIKYGGWYEWGWEDLHERGISVRMNALTKNKIFMTDSVLQVYEVNGQPAETLPDKLYVDDVIKLKVNCVPSAAVPEEITWEYDSEQILLEKINDDEVAITLKQPGSTTLSVCVRDGENTVEKTLSWETRISLKDVQLKVTSINGEDAGETSEFYLNDVIRLKAEYTPDNVKIKEVLWDYDSVQVDYESNEKEEAVLTLKKLGDILIGVSVSDGTNTKNATVVFKTLLKPVLISKIESLNTGGFKISWNADEGVKYNVYRRSEGESDFILLQENGTEAAYTDTTVEEGKAYFYKVQAVKDGFVSNLEKTQEIGQSFLQYGEIIPEDRVNLKEIPEGIWVAGIKDLNYNGTKQTQEFRVYDGNKLLVAGKDYTVTFKNNLKAFVAEEKTANFNANKAPQAVLKMKGDYSGSKSVYFKIMPLNLEENIVANDVYVTYNGKKQTPVPNITWNGKKLTAKDFYVKEYKTRTVDFRGKEDQTTQAELTIIGQGNFIGEKVIKFTIGKRNREISMNQVKVSGVAKTVKWEEALAKSESGITLTGFQVMDGKKQLTEGKDYTVEYENNDAAGTATLVIKGTADSEAMISYYGVKRVNFTIKGTAINGIVVNNLSKTGYPYTGKAIEPLSMEGVKVTLKNGREIAEDAYEVRYEKNVDKGMASMIFTGNPKKGFSGTKKVNFKITALNLDNTYKAAFVGDGVNEDGSVVYTAGGTNPKVEVRNAKEELLIEGRDYTVSYKNNKAAAAANADKAPTAVIKGKGNYAKSIEQKFTIVKKVADGNENVLTISAKDKVVNDKTGGWKQSFKVLDKNGKALTAKDYDAKTANYYLAAENGEEINLTKNPATAVPAESVIRIEVSLTGNNYEGKAVGIYRILNKDKDISKATFKIKAKEYTTDAVELTMDDITKAELKQSSLTWERDYKIVGYEKNTNKGTAKVTFRGIGTYGGEKTVTFKIGQRNIVKYWKEIFLNLF